MIEDDKGLFKNLYKVKKQGILDYTYFANIIEVNGLGIAFCTDGVGTKAHIAQHMSNFSTLGIDCIAMNVNDLLCVGATPLSLVDCIIHQDITTPLDFLTQIGEGLRKGADEANISIAGGETADHSIKHHTTHNLDLIGAAIGLVDLDKIITGEAVQEGNVVIGLASTGIHANGISTALEVLPNIWKLLPELGETVGRALLTPTAIYVSEVLDMLKYIPIKGLVHITGGGFRNLLRIYSCLGFKLCLPRIPTIFNLIKKAGNFTDEFMIETYNLGIGFCVIVEKGYESNIITIADAHGRSAYRIGVVVKGNELHLETLNYE